MPQKKSELTFEKALVRMDEISSLLSSGKADMDQALELFKEGLDLAAFCDKKLKDAEQQIKIVTADGEVDA